MDELFQNKRMFLASMLLTSNVVKSKLALSRLWICVVNGYQWWSSVEKCAPVGPSMAIFTNPYPQSF